MLAHSPFATFCCLVNAQQEPDRRLHPLSMLFDAAGQVRSLLIPLAVVFFSSRSENRFLIASALGGAFAIIASIWEWFTYRFRYDEHELVVRSGKIFRNERHIPYNRIQNIDAVQNVAHRLFDVAVVQVQTGSGSEPEATLKVLTLPALAEMRERVFARRVDAVPDADALHEEGAGPVEEVQPARAKAAPTTLLHLPPRELLLAGLIENRGMALIVATIAALSRFDPLEEVVFDRLERWLPAWAPTDAAIASRAGNTVVLVVITVLVLLLFVRIISTLWALIRLYDFKLVRDGDDLRVEYGMFTKVVSTIPLGRVQTISLHRRFLHRRTQRAAIRVTTAGGSGPSDTGSKGREREWLAPIVAEHEIIPLLRHLDASISFDELAWRHAHPGASWRLFRVAIVWTTIVSLGSAYFIGWWALAIATALVIRAFARSRGIVRNLGVALKDGRAFFRSGWFHHIVTVVRFERVQSTSFRESFFDRRTGMATVSVVSAGTGSGSLRMPLMRREEAVSVYGEIERSVSRTPFVW